ncbi:MAG: hypothetical protein ABL932_24960, partial [Terricaulis sp.]
MNLTHLLFGQKPTSSRSTPISEVPAGARMRKVRAREAPAKLAWLAESDAKVDTEHGVLQAHGGKDYVLAHGPGEHSVIRKDIFEAMYEPLGGGLYRKRTDVIFRYFTLKRRVLVQTLEGPQVAK